MERAVDAATPASCTCDTSACVATPKIDRIMVRTGNAMANSAVTLPSSDASSLFGLGIGISKGQCTFDQIE